MDNSSALAIKKFRTPVGKLLVAANEKGVRICCFEEHAKQWPELEHSTDRPSATAQKIAKNAQTSILEYLSGTRDDLSYIPVAPEGTPFQKRVWKALRRIPVGKTLSYSELAAKLGSPSSARAVGNACGANPVVMFIPCHRVLAKGGSLGGFSAGLDRKSFLLDHEGVTTH